MAETLESVPPAAPEPGGSLPRAARLPVWRRATTGPASIGLAIGAASIGLALAYLLKEPCATNGWANNFQYRHLCYNDIQPLFYVRGIFKGQIPYKDVFVEYPVLIGSFMYVTGRLLALLVTLHLAGSYRDPQYFNLTALLLAPCSLIVTFLLRPRVSRGRLLLWAIGTPTILYSFLNWDLLAVVALVAGIVLAEKRRWLWAGVALGLGASAKLYPGFLLPCVVLGAWSLKDKRGAVRSVLGFGAAAVVANVPWMVAAWKGWMGIWKFQAGRYPDYGTTWYWLAHIINTYHYAAFWSTNIGGWGSFIGDAGGLAFGVLTLLILYSGWRRRDEDGEYPMLPIGLAIMATFLFVSKVNSPQYAIWVLPLLTLVDIPWWEVGLYLFGDVVLFVSGFYWFTDANFPGPSGWSSLFEYSVFFRAAILAVIALTAVGTGRRLLPASEPAVDPSRPSGRSGAGGEAGGAGAAPAQPGMGRHPVGAGAGRPEREPETEPEAEPELTSP
ncbi:MAG TPA: glycosyltransferase 87 family protein [Actinomycetota bacterium]|nr:glycosyltransferase 87 family protein [Actinomycetota bacterium]